jgi:hypothetical protein
MFRFNTSIIYDIVTETVVRRRSRRKPAAKIVLDTEIMKNTPIHVFSKSASVTFNYWYNFSPIHSMHFWVRGILQKMDGPRVRRPPVKLSAIA